MPDKLIVRGLTKRYGQVDAVRGVSFEVRDGEVFGLLGPNGAGKTSTIECIIGLRQPDGGEIQLCGIDALATPKRVKELIGVALQSTFLQEKITPREALKLFGSFYARRADVDGLLTRFSLVEKADASFDTLSGGQRQRLALALAFVNEPEVVFLDEPTTGLDPQSRRDLHADILKMRGEGRTVVLTTHYIEEAHLLCDRLAIIDHGKVIAIGRPEDLIKASRTAMRITVLTTLPLDPAGRKKLTMVQGVSVDGNKAVLETGNIGQTVVDLLKMLEQTHNELVDLQISRPSLEDVFIERTGAALRD